MKKLKVAKRWKALVAAMCTLALAVTPAFAAWGDDASESQDASLTTQSVSTGELLASAQENEMAGTVAKRIKSFKLSNKNPNEAGAVTYDYKSLGGDPTLTLSTSALQGIVKTELLPRWSGVAAAIFRDQAGQLVDLYGEQPNKGNMSQNGFDAYFNMSGSGNTKYKDETWSCYSLRDKLAQTDASHAGDPGWDQFAITGVKRVSSLNEARTMMGQALRDCQNNDGLSVDEFLGVDEGGETRLDALQSDDSTTGFVNIVTAINCKGSSSDFDYVSFGIVFYDFEPVPVAANGLAYVNAGFVPGAPEVTGSNHSAVQNGQQQDILHSAVLGDSVTETTTTTLSALASFKLKENIGANIGWSETESSSSTEFWASDEGAGAETSTSSESSSMGLNWGAAWELAGALGAEQGHSQSKEVSKAVETTIAIPAHTEAVLQTETSTTTYAQSYQQPVVLSYKVAIFAVSGDYYSSSAFGGMGAINPSRYDKQSLVIKLDTKDKAEAYPSYGCAATDDLYSRINNNKTDRYDVADGRTYSTHSSRSDWTKSEDIDWEAVTGTVAGYYGTQPSVNTVATTNYFYETPGQLNVKKDKTTSKVDEVYPLYDLASVTTPNSRYVLDLKNSTLNRAALTVEGKNKYGVPFYGFDSAWGEWLRCDSEGNIVNADNPEKAGRLLDTDPVTLSGDTLSRKEGAGDTIYLTWKITDENAKPVTVASPSGQNLVQDQAANKIKSPIVAIEVIDSDFDNPSITAEGSYTGYKKTSINLNSVMKYTVKNENDNKLAVQAKWDLQEYEDSGITVNSDTGVVTFTKAGTYHVRPYIFDNAGKRIYPLDDNGKYAWLTVVATEHDLVHEDAKDPTDCTGDNAYGWIEHYRCSDCGKYFSDAAGTYELSMEDLIVEATGHDWGEWATTKEASATTPGEQQRVCKNDSSHVETRSLYLVDFNMNGKAGEAPESQTIVSGASATAPGKEPKTDGFTFEGWYTDKECKNAYDFSNTVTGNLTLYANWTPNKYTVATTAVVFVTGSDGGQKITPASNCSVSIDGAGDPIWDEEGYSYSYKEAECKDTVKLTVQSDPNHELDKIQAVSIASGQSVDGADLLAGDVVPLTEADGTYSLTMPAADVAVVASFKQKQVTVTYDANVPEGTVVSNLPGEVEPFTSGSAYTLSTTTPTREGYTFDGWYTDSACTKPFLNNSKVTQNTTLYAKWTEEATPITKYTVTYTLSYLQIDPHEPADTLSYKVEAGSKAYDPTNELYAVVGQDALAKYELKKVGESCWFTNPGCTEAYDFETVINDDVAPVDDDTGERTLHLYATVINKKYTVTYFDGIDGGEELSTQSVIYGEKATKPKDPTKNGCTFAGWVTKDGEAWDFSNDTVTSDQALYATWTCSVTFDTNGHGGAIDSQTVDPGGKATKPKAPTADGYTFGGWYTDKACANEYSFETPVTSSLTLYAKWTTNKYKVTFNVNGHGGAIDSQTVEYNAKATQPKAPTADDYTFGGWFTDQACTKAYDFNTAVTGNLTLYAKWTKNSNPATVMYRTHVQSLGWQGFVSDGDMSGTSGRSLRLEGIEIKLKDQPYSGDIEYRTHIQRNGWEGSYKKNGTMSGTSGQALRLEAIQIRLTGEMAEHYDVYYRVHCQSIGWMGWAKNDAMAGSAGFAYRLEAIEIMLVEKGDPAPGSTAGAFRNAAGDLSGVPDSESLVLYQTHVQRVGWQNWMRDGEMGGTSGQSLRLEGINIKLGSKPYKGGIEYRTHIQSIGWETDFKKNGEMSGTSGRALRLEAIEIRLTGEMAEHYDVYYRVHAQKVGWMGWAKNGEPAGTAGYAYRLEGINIVLVPKGGTPPSISPASATSTAFMDRSNSTSNLQATRIAQ
ncbi:MAG: InlB B-repeat-containing protein [Eggerthellaceae bacterium]|nr:InlB B-repeat-containing protein [Eggerthellaceae bacterium]